MNTKLFFAAFLLLKVFLLPFNAFSQKEANHWIFDINTYIDFSPGYPVATVPPQGSCGSWIAPNCYFILSGENASCISDKNGNLLLYTNNHVIYNSNFDTIQNGILSSSEFSRQCIIIPRPQRSNRYYVITTPWWQASQGVKFTEVDIFANGGLGSVISSNNVLLPNACQKVTAVYHKNQIDIWVLVHQYHSNAFYAFLVTKNGINLTPVISNIGTSHTEDPNSNYCTADLAGNGEMKFSTDGDKVACAIKGLDIVEVLDFNNETGVLTNPIPISCGEVESVEFSTDGTLLYTGSFPIVGVYGGCNLIVEGTSSKIRQFDLISGDSLVITDSNKLINEENSGWKQYLQLGPDRKIYSISEIAQNFHENIGVISNPNDTGVTCNFNSNGFTFPTWYNLVDRNVLPNFFRSALDRNIMFENVCFGDTTMIFTLTNTNFDSIMWEFEDVVLGTQTIWNEDTVLFNFTRPGSYTITLDRYRDGYLDQTQKTLNLLPNIDLSFTDTTICQGSEYIFDLNVPYCNFGWINSVSPDTFLTDSFIINQNTMFWPVLLNFHDYCGSMDNIQISVYPDYLDLGSDTSNICINNPLSLNAEVPNAASYLWSNNSTFAQLWANTSGTYSTTVTTQDGCIYRDTILVNYDLVPNPGLDSIALLCPNALLTIHVNDMENEYIWQPMGLISDTVTITSPGIYWITTQNSCGVFTDSIEVLELDIPYVYLPQDTSICLGDSVVLQLDFPFSNILWSTGQSASSIQIAEAGNYHVIVENLCGTGNDDFNMSLILPQSMDLPNDTIICLGDSLSIILPDESNTSFLWSTGDTSNSLVIKDMGQYFFQASDLCFEYTDSIEILTHKNDFSFLEDTLELDSSGMTILEPGFGYISYIWSTNETSQSIEITIPGEFWLMVTDSVGCTATDTIIILPYISISELSASYIHLYPNPTTGELNLDRLKGGEIVEIYDVLGKKLLSIHSITSTLKLNLSIYSEGIYLLKIKSHGQIFSARILKE